MANKRIFAAIDISDDARTIVADYASGLRLRFHPIRVGWEKPEKLHLTLKFFGDVDSEKIVRIEETLDKIASNQSPFTAELAETGVFPNTTKPRVLWLGIQNDDGIIKRICDEIETASRALWFKPEDRPFRTHLTIARIREPAKGRDLASTHIKSHFRPLGFEIKELVLYESKLSPSSSVYNVVSRHELRG